MTSKEAYKRFLLKVNKNDSNSNIRISKGEFVITFNEMKRTWLSENLIDKASSHKIHELENLLVPDVKLPKIKKDNNSIHFKFPLDLFQYDSSYSIAKKGKCVTSLVNWLVKPKNVRSLLEDTNNNPSFEYEETICILSEGNLVVYITDFDITEQHLSYYKEPKDLDLEGYINIQGLPSSDIDPIDLNDKQIDEIINRCALEITMRYDNIPSTQLASERIKREF